MIEDNDMDDRLINTDVIENIESNDISLRPRRISEFIGQPQVQKNLSTFIIDLISSYVLLYAISSVCVGIDIP